MDARELAGLHRAAFAGAAARPWSEAEFRDLLAMPGTTLLTEADAFALLRVVADESELLTIATHPAARRRGQAHRLLKAVHATAADRGATRIFLEVAADNAAAIALYNSFGYRESGRRRRYYARPGTAPVDALLMDRSLTLGQGSESG